MKVAITGANGFVGSHLTKTFNDFVKIERTDSEEEIFSKLQDVEVVFNLAGAPIMKRWSSAYKKELISSRIELTKRLVNAINRSDVKQFISTSAIGAYCDDIACNESSNEYGDDFLASLTKAWEIEANRCNKPTSIVRFGVVLGKDGGALSQMLVPFTLGLGGRIGDGKMMMSWIDIDDLVRIYSHLIKNKLTGVFNATAPLPVTNLTFTKTLGKVLHKPTILPVPAFILKLLFGEGSTVLTASKEVYPTALIESGYEFLYQDIERSLLHLLRL